VRFAAIILLYLSLLSFTDLGMSHDYAEDEEKGGGKEIKGIIKEAAGVVTDNREW
jgi:hypothetical protein